MSAIDLLPELEGVFSRHPRPETSTNADHCSECAQHNRTLSQSTPASVGIEDLGHAGMDPLCFATAEAYLYLFPGLARVAATDESHGWIGQFLFHLSSRVHLLTAAERRLVADFIWRLVDDLQEATNVDEQVLHTADDCLRQLELPKHPQTTRHP